MTEEEIKIRRTLKNQKSRCYNKNIRSFKTYGARGIKVLYTYKELLFWYLSQPKEIRSKKNITIGRIDHSKNYSLDNIELQTNSDNSREMHKRTLLHTKKIKVWKNGKYIGTFKSGREIEKVFGFKHNNLAMAIRNKSISKNGLTFAYKEEE